MIEFSLFGIPIRITPWAWVGLALIGGGLHVSGVQDVLPLLIFVIAGMITFLVHELGHGLMAKKFGKNNAFIELGFLRGTTHFQGCSFSKWVNRGVIFAGPGSNFLLLCLSWIIFLSFKGENVPSSLGIFLTLNPYFVYHANISITSQEFYRYYFIASLMATSFWWGIYNIMPILPMDGGQFMATFFKRQATPYLISMITAIVLALIFLIFFGSLLGTLITLWFAFLNGKAYKNLCS